MKIEKCVVSIFVTILTVFGVYLTGYADVTPVSERTPQVRDAIVAAVPGVNNAADVTAAHLAAITSLNLWNSGITELKSDDFSGMTALTWLNLFRNQLSSLPSGIFAGMSLTTIKLGRNTVDPLPLTVSLEQVTEGVFKAVAPTGALFNIVLPITVTNGSITGGATTLTIPRGSVESSTLTVTPTAGTTADVTVDIGTLPSIPSGHNGYVLVKSGNLPLTVTSGSNTAPVFTEGIRARRTVAENTPAGTNIGTPVAATDADNDMLTYSLGWLEGSPVFSIDRHTGQLRTKAPLDYETKNSYSFSVFADDGKGDRVVIIVTINVTDVSETLANNPSTNSAPEFTEGTSATRSVTENTASGTNIGSAVSATDADNDTLTYSLSGTDASSFSIVSTSGQLQTSGVLDYQTKNSYFVTVSVSDGNGGSDSITVTINVTDVSEPEPEPEPEDEE
ncbi:MAG: cadherin domain-containing protein, partial [Candidatus Poribacteria bacterium]|nr:cadherin domain-containing protein [Candidatus Poribacteria bacterium]